MDLSLVPPRSQEDRAAEDPAAAQSVERALFPELLGYAWHSLSRLGVPESDRDELAQEVVIAAYKRRHDYDPRRSSLKQWCRGFVINIVRNYGRNNHTIMGPFKELTPDLVDEKPGPEEHYMVKTHHWLLHEVLLPQVTFNARVVVIAYDLDSLDFKTIAAQENIPVSTAHARYKSGRKQLQAAYERHLREQQARGLFVMPFTLEQLLAADRTIPDLPLELVNRTRSQVERVLAGQERWQLPQTPGPRPKLETPAPRPKLVLIPTFLAGAAVGAALFALLRSPAHPDVVVVQPDPAEAAPVAVNGTSTPGVPPPATTARSTPPRRSPSPRDSSDAKRDFEIAYQAFEHGNYDAASAALAAHERNFPASSFANERKNLRDRIAAQRDAGGPALKLDPAPTNEP